MINLLFHSLVGSGGRIIQNAKHSYLVTNLLHAWLQSIYCDHHQPVVKYSTKL